MKVIHPQTRVFSGYIEITLSVRLSICLVRTTLSQRMKRYYWNFFTVVVYLLRMSKKADNPGPNYIKGLGLSFNDFTHSSSCPCFT